MEEEVRDGEEGWVGPPARRASEPSTGPSPPTSPDPTVEGTSPRTSDPEHTRDAARRRGDSERHCRRKPSLASPVKIGAESFPPLSAKV